MSVFLNQMVLGLFSWCITCNSEPLKLTRISAQSGGESKRPRFGFCFPAKIFNAVDLPIPLVPTRPNTWPGRGIGNRCSLKEFGPYLCVWQLSSDFGKLMILMASNGHFFTQMPQPMHNSSDMNANFEFGDTSIHSLPRRTTGHDLLHSCLHFLGLHLSSLIRAILVSLSDMSQCDFSLYFRCRYSEALLLQSHTLYNSSLEHLLQTQLLELSRFSTSWSLYFRSTKVDSLDGRESRLN